MASINKGFMRRIPFIRKWYKINILINNYNKIKTLTINILLSNLLRYN
jgi:hypothetical protein